MHSRNAGISGQASISEFVTLRDQPPSRWYFLVMTNAETARAMRGENTAESQLVEKVNKPTKSVPAASTEAFEQVEDRSSLTLPFKRTNREGFGPVHKPLVTHSLKS